MSGLDKYFQPIEEKLEARETADAERERKYEALLAPLAAQAKAIQLAVFVGEAVAELELLLSSGRSDFSPQFEAMWKTGVKQSINRLKAMKPS